MSFYDQDAEPARPIDSLRWPQTRLVRGLHGVLAVGMAVVVAPLLGGKGLLAVCSVLGAALSLAWVAGGSPGAGDLVIFDSQVLGVDAEGLTSCVDLVPAASWGVFEGHRARALVDVSAFSLFLRTSRRGRRQLVAWARASQALDVGLRLHADGGVVVLVHGDQVVRGQLVGPVEGIALAQPRPET